MKAQIKAVALTNIASSTVSGTYQAINTGLPNPCIILYIINNSTEDVTVSYDGTNDNDYVPKGLTREIQAQTNSLPNTKVCEFAKGTIVYVKGTAGTGNVYLAGYYQPNDI